MFFGVIIDGFVTTHDEEELSVLLCTRYSIVEKTCIDDRYFVSVPLRGWGFFGHYSMYSFNYTITANVSTLAYADEWTCVVGCTHRGPGQISPGHNEHAKGWTLGHKPGSSSRHSP